MINGRILLTKFSIVAGIWSFKMMIAMRAAIVVAIQTMAQRRSVGS